MKVILTTTIKKLGKMGDKVTVKPGFARNYLFPNKMALRENKKNLDKFSLKYDVSRDACGRQTPSMLMTRSQKEGKRVLTKD